MYTILIVIALVAGLMSTIWLSLACLGKSKLKITGDDKDNKYWAKRYKKDKAHMYHHMGNNMLESLCTKTGDGLNDIAFTDDLIIDNFPDENKCKTCQKLISQGKIFFSSEAIAEYNELFCEDIITEKQRRYLFHLGCKKRNIPETKCEASLLIDEFLTKGKR